MRIRLEGLVSRFDGSIPRSNPRCILVLLSVQSEAENEPMLEHDNGLIDRCIPQLVSALWANPVIQTDGQPSPEIRSTDSRLACTFCPCVFTPSARITLSYIIHAGERRGRQRQFVQNAISTVLIHSFTKFHLISLSKQRLSISLHYLSSKCDSISIMTILKRYCEASYIS